MGLGESQAPARQHEDNHQVECSRGTSVEKRLRPTREGRFPPGAAMI
jgi:hypothetical protein